MRLVTLGGIGALACVAVALACTDQPSAPQARTGLGEGSMVRIHGTGTFTVHRASGPDVHVLAGWSAAGGIKNGLAREEGSALSLGVLGITNVAFLPAAVDGKHRTATFTDPAGARHDVVWINSPDGSPPRKVAHFIDGKLMMVTTYGWRAVSGGWTVASVSHAAYRDGKPTSEGTLVAEGAAGLASRAGTSIVSLLASRVLPFVAPADANAQILAGKCRTQWLQYIAAQAALSAATIALELAPKNPALYAAWLAAAAAATLAEMNLWLCQENLNGPIGKPHGGDPNGPPVVDCTTNPDPIICVPPDEL